MQLASSMHDARSRKAGDYRDERISSLSNKNAFLRTLLHGDFIGTNFYHLPTYPRCRLVCCFAVCCLLACTSQPGLASIQACTSWIALETSIGCLTQQQYWLDSCVVVLSCRLRAHLPRMYGLLRNQHLEAVYDSQMMRSLLLHKFDLTPAHTPGSGPNYLIKIPFLAPASLGAGKCDSAW